MKALLRIFLALACLSVPFVNLTWAQAPEIHSLQGAVPPAGTDPDIAEMVSSISQDKLKQLVAKLVSFGTRHTLSDTLSDSRGIGAARRWVRDELTRYAEAADGRMEVILDPYFIEPSRRIPDGIYLNNVMATLRGTDPNDDRIFLISGHLDSRASDVMDGEIDAPGANDDASGVALVMELARVMAQHDFPATVIFLAVSGEEQGLFGARKLAERAKAEGWNLVAMINNDMVGNSHASGTDVRQSDRLRVFSETIPDVESEEAAQLRRRTGGENDSPSRQLARYIKEAGEHYVPDHTVVLNYRIDRFLRGGDHTPFSQNGFTAVRMCEMHENYYHQHQTVREEEGIQYGDLPEYVDYDYLARNARVNIAALASLARSPRPPHEVSIQMQLGNVTRLSWEAPAEGPAPAGYYVLMRETYMPFWTHKFYTTEPQAALPYSKDNYFFAVQAVDEEGHVSLPVFPAPKWR